jgi:hypothetical protein
MQVVGSRRHEETCWNLGKEPNTAERCSKLYSVESIGGRTKMIRYFALVVNTLAV